MLDYFALIKSLRIEFTEKEITHVSQQNTKTGMQQQGVIHVEFHKRRGASEKQLQE